MVMVKYIVLKRLEQMQAMSGWHIVLKHIGKGD